MEKTEEEMKKERRKAIAFGISVLCMYIAAMSTKVAVYEIALPYFWKIIGFDMNVALVMADTVSTNAAVAISLFLAAMISGMYLVKKLR